MTDTARLGRKLMRLRQRIARESDAARLRKLRKAEVQTMLELGQPEQAAGLAEKLAADFPDWAAGWALLGDLRCRLSRWDAAEEVFARAVELREAAGADSAWLRQGPLYLLAEARGDHGRCRELAGTGTDTGRVLRCRALRLMGRDGRFPRAGRSEPLAGRLLLLERAWRGADPRIMPPALDGWEDEPEWRWRFVVEGVQLFERAGLSPSPWKKALRAFDAPVADPRYASERKSLEKLL